MAISHQQAKRVGDDHLRARASTLRAGKAHRNARYEVWMLDYYDTADPDGLIVGGALVVTDDAEVYDVGSVPGALDDLMIALDRFPGIFPREHG